jgi:hypothetical protein
VESADKAWGEEVDALASVVYVTNRYETAKRNVHNGKLKKAIARHERVHGVGSGAGLTLRGEGFVPTVKDEARRYAEHQLAKSEEYMHPGTARLLSVQEWAVRRLDARRNVRLGAEDGIPF